MSEQLRDRACIVGIGESAYGKRGTLAGVGAQRLAVDAVRAACADAGIDVADLEGFTSFNDDANAPAFLGPALGINQWTYASMVWGGGGSGLPTATLNAVMAVVTGVCTYAVVLRSIVQGAFRMGGSFVDRSSTEGVGPPGSYSIPFGLVVPPAFYAMRARRHMAVYGTTEDHLAAVAVAQRRYAFCNPLAVYRDEITVEDHHRSRLVVDPLRLLDCCMESDGATALVITTAERGRDLRQPPVYVSAIGTRTAYRWGTPITYAETDDMLASAGHRAAAEELYASGGAGPGDVDVALLYDGASIGVIMGLEDWMFVERGDGGRFVADGNTTVEGELPVNTHGGNLSECYMQGASHLVEGVRQLRGTSCNQVRDAEVALYASGMGYAPMGGILLRRG